MCAQRRIFTLNNHYTVMRKTILLLVALATASLPVTARDGEKKITLEDIYKNGTFRMKGVPGFNAMKNGKHYTQIDREGKRIYIRVYDLATGDKLRTLFDNSIDKFSGKELEIEGYTLSENEEMMLLFAEGEHIYRHSQLRRVFMYDISSGSIKLLDYDKVLHATFSPDGSKVAFVKNNNLYYKDIATDMVVPVTNDGAKGRIINGNCDWVYEEEFSFTKAFEWAKNGRYLAYYRFDESLVPEYTMAKYTGLYPDQYTYKYPKAGERNSVVQIKMYDLQSKRTTTANTGKETDQYLPRIKWAGDASKLCIYRLNRRQNKLDMLLSDAATGTSSYIYREENKCYIEIDDDITFLKDGHSMVLGSERNGYKHLYHWDWSAQRLTDLTKGSYDVEALTAVDVKRGLVYYTAADRSPLQRQLYVTDYTGNNRKCLTPENGTHAITPCEGNNYFLDRYSMLNKVPVYYLRDAKGNIVRTLEDNHELQAKLDEYDLGKLKMVKVQGAAATLNAWMITPPNFDPSKKYPVLMFQYSGPGSQQVADKFPIGNYYWHQMLAQHGYIIVCADGTGTGYRGEAFRKKTYMQLGKYESDDQIAVAKSLAALPYVDAGRIGIWGWSYGGFMSATCIMKGNDVFKTAISVAPVTNWRYYDNIYTERYMRTPQENPKGYDENAPEKMADKLKGRLLLVHGTADDNVHFQNSAMFTTALIKANKQFDNEYYPDKAHGISGGNTSLHLYTKMTNFILDNL
ncbi:S9 family peptidase [Nemorincola caseinilytica]|uniref:S9 family peptidase n=2 Tax=Nemorincola caseinilytica TaxID=2054315 RepID=A0ABP8NCE6_9BACT